MVFIYSTPSEAQKSYAKADGKDGDEATSHTLAEGIRNNCTSNMPKGSDKGGAKRQCIAASAQHIIDNVCLRLRPHLRWEASQPAQNMTAQPA